MIQLSTNEPDAALSFANKLVSSESFKTLFRDGMTLVEETAGYLDGEGREDAKKSKTNLMNFIFLASLRLGGSILFPVFKRAQSKERVA